MTSFNTDTMELVLLSVVGALFLIQLLYYLTIYNRIIRYNGKIKQNLVNFSNEFPPVSVIICAKNESFNLREFLPSLLEQDYPKYEVVVINNGSSDETEELLAELEKKYEHLYHSFTPDNPRGISQKKLGVTLGIKASKYDWLVFTEANCYPASNNWLKMMARNFTPNTEIVLGYSGYEKGKSWLHQRISFDSLFMAMRYLGFALAHKPYMGIGRNMAYRKELFFKEKGFSSHLNLKRGDDDLFINKTANGKNTKVEISADAAIRMKPVEYYRDWTEEKVSYMATSKNYKGAQRHLLGFETFSRILFYIAVILMIIIGIINHNWIFAGIAALLWLIRFFTQMYIVNSTAKVVGEPRRYYFSLPIFDLWQPVQSAFFKLHRKNSRKGDYK